MLVPSGCDPRRAAACGPCGVQEVGPSSSSCCATRSPSCAAPTHDHGWTGPTGPCSPPASPGCPEHCVAIVRSRRTRSWAGIAASSADDGICAGCLPGTKRTTTPRDRIGRCGCGRRARHRRFPSRLMAGSGVDRSWAGSSTSTRRRVETAGQAPCLRSGTPTGCTPTSEITELSYAALADPFGRRPRRRLRRPHRQRHRRWDPCRPSVVVLPSPQRYWR